MASRQNEILNGALSTRNYFEIVVSFLTLLLGAVIFIRSLRETGLIMGAAFGVAFCLYGVYRVRHIWKYFSNKNRHGSSMP